MPLYNDTMTVNEWLLTGLAVWINCFHDLLTWMDTSVISCSLLSGQ